MAPPADPRPGRRPRRRLLTILVTGFLAGSGGFAALALGRSAGWSWPAAGVVQVASPAPGAASAAGGSPPVGSPGSPGSSNGTPSQPPESSPPGSAPPAGPSLAEQRSAALRTALQASLDADRRRYGIPGVSVTILLGDGSSWTGTSGLADVATATAVTPDTAFALGSISKTYTAALIVALAGEGKIDLAAPARTYLPTARIDPRITVRMLLDHTSGLDDFFLHPPIDTALLAQPSAIWTAARSLHYVGKRYFEPGAGWHYSNTNYLYLGLIAERVTGKPLATSLRERFFMPLDLRTTWYQAVDQPRSGLAHGYRFAGPRPTATPIDLADGTGVAPFRSVVTAAGGAGSIAATSGDVARWARLLYDGSAIGPVQTAAMVDDIATSAGYRPHVPYGLGVQVFPIDGRLTFGHSGRLLGFQAVVRHIPAFGTTIAVLTNQSRADPAIIVRHLLVIVFAPRPPCGVCARPS